MFVIIGCGFAFGVLRTAAAARKVYGNIIINFN